MEAGVDRALFEPLLQPRNIGSDARLEHLAGGPTVAFGRIYGSAHLPLDVAGGIGVGLLAGTFSRWAFGLGGVGVPPR